MAREAIILIAEEETYKNLVTFSDIEDMNETVRTYKDVIKKEVKRKDVQKNLLRLLDLLKRHSCKHLGVSFLSKNSLADKLELSYKTIQRLMIRLTDFGFIKEYAMKRRSNMYQTSNAVIIQPVKTDSSNKEEPKQVEKSPSKTTNKNLKTNNINTYKERTVIHNNTNTVNNIKNAEFVAHWVPARFTELSNSYFSKAREVEELWKVVRQNNRPVNGEKLFTKAQELEIGLTALKQYVMKYKNGVKIKKSMFAYFNGIVDKLMTKFYFDADFMTVN
ncbi:HTH binding domain protein [Bacillus phage Juglone]|uniref:HTH binding domain protein n=1 Tax=Bacillus phage Juglone TaxID=1805949 RepID=A0A143FHT7_9CAUD|nr:HTH binding domain protein [Bacillus phage Juglone]